MHKNTLVLFNRRVGKIQGSAGMTLVEIMIAFAIFSVVATGIVGTLIQSRKYAEINIYEATAQTVAQSIIEQVQLIPYNILSQKSTSTTEPDPVPLHFVAAKSDNTALLQDFLLKWAPANSESDEKAYTYVGEVVAGTPKGVLLDMDYRTTEGTVVREKKYMQIRVNLQKAVNAANGNVVIVLTYQWEIPNRKSLGPVKSLVYQTRQIRTVRSDTSSY